jgi:hypothetical protein
VEPPYFKVAQDRSFQWMAIMTAPPTEERGILPDALRYLRVVRKAFRIEQVLTAAAEARVAASFSGRGWCLGAGIGGKTAPTMNGYKDILRASVSSQVCPSISRRCQADFLCGKPNGITFPCCSDGIHLVAFFLKLLGT